MVMTEGNTVRGSVWSGTAWFGRADMSSSPAGATKMLADVAKVGGATEAFLSGGVGGNEKSWSRTA